jgi:hypothetical protein
VRLNGRLRGVLFDNRFNVLALLTIEHSDFAQDA